MLAINNLLKVILIHISVFALQMLVYWGTQFFAKKPNVIGNKFDEMIPFVPHFIFPYVSWYAILFFMPFVLYLYSLETYALYVMSLVMVNLITGVVYLVYPTTFDRPDPEGDGVSVKLVRKIYSMDTKILICMPSLHCSLSTLFILAAAFAIEVPLVLRLVIIVISFLIILSTVFVKQHMVIDVITAVPLSVICWYIAMAIGADVFLSFFAFI